MSKNEFIYLIAETAAGIELPSGIQPKRAFGKIEFVKDITDCLNAEQNGAEAVIWSSNKLNLLEELSPKKSKYGWMLVSINIPILFHIKDVMEIDNLENIKIQGFYSENLDVLLASQKKMETLQGE
jgi:hypothetical protein